MTKVIEYRIIRLSTIVEETKMVQLPPTEFTFGKYEGQLFSTEVFMDKTKFVAWLQEQNIVGYCDSLEVEIRPRPGNVAVMFEEDDYQTWCHIPNAIWQAYKAEIKLSRRLK